MHPRDVPVHFTNLREMSKSPLHYLTRVASPSEPTAAMRFGTLVHTLAVGGPQPIIYDGPRSGDGSRKALKAFKEAHKGVTVYMPEDIEEARWCAESLRSNPRSAPLLVGQHELEIDWAIGATACSSRLDVLGDGFITEIKTASCVQPDRFRSACIGRYAYHAQLAFYRMAAAWRTIEATRAAGKVLRDVPRRECFIVGVETRAPFDVIVFRLTERCLDAGGRLCHAWLTRLQSCLESDQWPGYAQHIIDLDDDAADDLIFDDPDSPSPGEEAA